MKNSKRVVRLCLIISAVSFAAFLFYYPGLPDVVPIHWNIAGEVDRHGPKSALLFTAALPFLATLLMAALPRLDPRRQNYARHAKVYNIFVFALTLVFTVISWLLVLQAKGIPLPVGRILPCLMGILFMLMGNWMPQIKPNYFMGIRTPWALENETVWHKTHRAGGVLFVVCGALVTLSALLPWQGKLSIVWVILLLLGTAWLYLYSYLIYKKIHGRKEDDTNAEN